MALDWSKDISFSGLRKAGRRDKRTALPEKTHMNFAVADKRSAELRRAVPLAVLLVVAVAAFSHFGVHGLLGRSDALRVELVQRQQALSSLEAQLTGYDDVLGQYQSYVSAPKAGGDGSASADEALELVERAIAPQATVVSVDFRKETLSLSLTDISLEGLGTLADSLRGQPEVADVSVSTAATGQTAAGDVAAAMVVTMRKAGD